MPHSLARRVSRNPRRYTENVLTPTPRSRTTRRVVIGVLLVAVVVLLGATTAVVLPILTHQSAGGSGQSSLPAGYVSEVRAEGADGRVRTLSVDTLGGEPADLSRLTPGDTFVVHGTGFDADIGIYVGICAVPPPGEKPSPCLGGIPDTAQGAEVAETSVWITDDWAWSAFANQGYDHPGRGEFTARLLVGEPVSNGLDCTVTRCAITTRADHTASGDRVQDIQLPVAFTP